MWTFSWKKRPALGIDIGCRTIRVLGLSRTRRGYRVEGFGEHELPPDTVQDKRIKNPEAVAASLRAALDRCDVKRSRCVVAMPASLVMTRQLEFPAALIEAELELHVRLEAERQLPFPSSELALDFTSLPSVSPSSTNVMLAACRKEQMDERLTLLHAADCDVSVVAMETQVVERTFRLACGEAGQLVALVDLQITSLALYLMRDGRVVHWREQTLSVASNEDASLALVAADLASQLQRILQLLRSSTDATEVKQLWLAGVGAERAGLAQKLSQLLNLPVSIADPVASFSDVGADTAIGPALFMAAGLALRGLEDD